VLLTLLAIPDIPDEIAKWEQWLTDFVTDPRVHAVAVWASEVARIHNEIPVRLALGVIGIALLVWPARRFWRFRSKVWFLLRRTVTEIIWIDESKAFGLVHGSSWARYRFNRNKPSVWTQPLMAGYGRDDMYIRWCQKVLEHFEGQLNASRRAGDGKTEYNEGALRSYLQELYDSAVLKEFGDPY